MGAPSTPTRAECAASAACPPDIPGCAPAPERSAPSKDSDGAPGAFPLPSIGSNPAQLRWLVSSVHGWRETTQGDQLIPGSLRFSVSSCFLRGWPHADGLSPSGHARSLRTMNTIWELRVIHPRYSRLT